ncbi:molybdopterin-dependent oxidoreductase [Limnohabitans sp. Rim8]|uniref:nitrate reductase n=1 Tax=Limnohabitans sp. Rim8 TaxID=1100718 RepID=UPI00330595A7
MIPITRETRSTCPYCGVGCGVIIESEGAQITGVRGDPMHPANFGRLCTKGSTLHLTASPTLAQHTRLLQPLHRVQRGAPAQAIGWSQALDMASSRLTQIVNSHGAEAVGFYISGQLLTEDYYVFNKLVKGLLGTNNIDSNSRLCMSSAVAGYKMTLGADAPPACYEDIALATCIFIVGSNAAWAHPILFRRIEDAKKANPGLKIIVADPRRTDTAELADLYLPLQPGSDVMLFHGLLHLMLREGWTQPAYIAAHTHGFEALQAVVQDATPERVAQICGINPHDLLQAARWFATSPATLSLYCQGLNQSSSGTAKNAALINLHLASAQIGKAGAGPLSLTGQPNAMGGREVGGMANLLSAHRDLANPQHRAEVAALWGVPEVPAKPGLTAVEMFQAAADGQIKALWIACTNPAQSMPDQATVRRALERAEFVVVQEAFATAATCDWADLLLPATTWGEKEGTVTNSERRISRVRAAVPPPGQARHDWQIVVDLGRRLEKTLARSAPHTAPNCLFAFDTPEAIWNEHRASTRGRDLDITGLSYALLEQAGPQQWPFTQGATQGLARLYEDGQFPTANGKAKFAAVTWQDVAEPRVSRFPFSLTTGHLRDQWHGMTRTGTLGRLFAHVPEPVVQMHGPDMKRHGIAEGELVFVTSKRGSLVVPAQASNTLQSAQVFMAMHWGSDVLSGRDNQGRPLAGVNALTTSDFCATAKQPELKHAAVRILKAELPWGLIGMAWLPEEQLWSARQTLQNLMPRFSFAFCVPFSQASALGEVTAHSGLLFRAADDQAPDAAVLVQIAACLGLNQPGVMHYQDARRGQRRAAHLSAPQGPKADRHLTAFMLAGDTQSAEWLQAVLFNQNAAQGFGRHLLQPSKKPPVPLAAAPKQVCSCWNVSEDAILNCLRPLQGESETKLTHLQAELQCGTQCGSCVPELRRLIRQNSSSVANSVTVSA